MEVHEAGVWLPWLDHPAHPRVVQPTGPSEPSREAFLSADIVARKHMQTAETSQQHVLRRPSSDTAQFEQSGADLVVVSTYQPFEVDSAPLDGASQRQQGVDFLAAEPNRVVSRRPKSRHVAWGWKPVVSIAGCSTPHVADSRQSIKQLETDLERQLLAGERIDERPRRRNSRIHPRFRMARRDQQRGVRKGGCVLAHWIARRERDLHTPALGGER